MADDASLLKPSRAGLISGLLAALALILLFLHLHPLHDNGGKGAVLLSDISIVDALGGTEAAHQDLLWRDGRIVARGPHGSLKAPLAVLRPGQGLWVMAAPADAAVFLSLEGRLPADSVPALAQQSLRLQARAGVGLLLDLNAHRSFMDQARALGPGYPRVRFAGALFTAPGGWRLSGQTPWDSHVAELTEMADLDAPWARVLRFHDQAVFASVEHDGRDDIAIPLPVLKALGSQAHDQGLPFIIQVQHHSKALLALEARPDALLGPIIDAGDDTRLGQALHDGHCLYLPALGSVLNSLQGDSLRAWLKAFPLSAAIDPAVLDAATDPERSQVWVKHWTRQGVDTHRIEGLPAALAAHGATLAMGTGSGLPLVFHGLGWQVELAWLSYGGLTPAQMCAAALRGRLLMNGGSGALERGQPADLVLLGADPLKDPGALLRPHLLVLDGKEIH